MLSQQFIDQMKVKLLEYQAKFQEDLSGLSMHTELGTEPDENAQEVGQDMVNANSIEQLTLDLEKIKVALEKIDQGTYGVDADGQEISEQRLDAIPWAETAL